MSDYIKLQEAIQLAEQFHRGHFDCEGQPMFLHLSRVALKCEPDIEAMIVAYCHDLNDIEGALEKISGIFSDKVYKAIRLIANDVNSKNWTYEEYIQSLLSNPLALKVKLADLLDNLNPRRLKFIKRVFPKKFSSWVVEHADAIRTIYNEKEEWKVIPEDKKYKISSLGRVINNKTNKILKPWINNAGYLSVYLSNSKVCYIHRVVCKLFLKPNSKTKEVNHKNGIKVDNRVSNLEYTTRKENIRHSQIIGSFKTKISRGELNPNSTLSEKQVIDIRKYKQDNPSIKNKDLASLFNTGKQAISKILNNRTWNC